MFHKLVLFGYMLLMMDSDELSINEILYGLDVLERFFAKIYAQKKCLNVSKHFKKLLIKKKIYIINI